MAAATTPINTPEFPSGAFHKYPVVAAGTIYTGWLVAIDSSGNLNPAADTAGLEVVGRAEEDGLNASGSAGAISIKAKRGVFKFLNSATNPVLAANVLGPAYVQDNQTVCVLAGSTNKILAGLILGIDPVDGGIWVDTRESAVGTYTMTAATVATAAATDLTTSEALANALKTAVNALIVDVQALINRSV